MTRFSTTRHTRNERSRNGLRKREGKTICCLCFFFVLAIKLSLNVRCVLYYVWTYHPDSWRIHGCVRGSIVNYKRFSGLFVSQNVLIVVATGTRIRSAWGYLKVASKSDAGAVASIHRLEQSLLPERFIYASIASKQNHRKANFDHYTARKPKTKNHYFFSLNMRECISVFSFFFHIWSSYVLVRARRRQPARPKVRLQHCFNDRNHFERISCSDKMCTTAHRSADESFIYVFERIFLCWFVFSKSLLSFHKDENNLRARTLYKKCILV